MPLFWFLAGVLSTLAALVVVSPWLRSVRRLGPPPPLPWQAAAGAAALLAVVVCLYYWAGRPDLVASSSANSAAVNISTTDVAFANRGAQSSKAGSMSSAIAALEARLTQGGGTAADWELLAKSYEFLGRPEDAKLARAERLPPIPPGDERGGFTAAAAQPDAVLTGEVSLVESMRSRVPEGATLFVVAKSVDEPGAPVAVFRSTPADWPVKFRLDDSLSMLPGRNLSSAGHVRIEARISLRGQPMPASGDLQGASDVIAPSDRHPLKILIDHVIS